MIRTKLAKKVLSKKEQQHLTKVANVHSMSAFVKSRKQQVAMRDLLSGKGMPEGIAEPCWECKHIAIVLGVGSEAI